MTGLLREKLAAANCVFIWGLGLEGRAALAYLDRLQYGGTVIAILDDPSQKPDLTPAENARLADVMDPTTFSTQTAQSPGNDVLIKSPGVPLNKVRAILGADSRITITSTTNLALENQNLNNCIAVTGTKGKTTTSSMLAAVLASKTPTQVAGNIGTPLLDLEPADGLLVIELSSYQCADIDNFPRIRVLTNLMQEHLDWHGSVAEYHHDKTRLFRRATDGISLVNGACENSVRLSSDWHGVETFGTADGVHFRGPDVFNGDTRIGHSQTLVKRGAHIVSNACAVIAVGLKFGIEPQTAIDILETVDDLPHRQSAIGHVNGVQFIDDSISTTPESTMAALARYQGADIHLLLGGKDRGLDFDAMIASLAGYGVVSVALVGETADRLRASFDNDPSTGSIAVTQHNDIASAVGWATNRAEKGAIVLLSPAAASYDQFANYIERADAFAKAAGL